MTLAKTAALLISTSTGVIIGLGANPALSTSLWTGLATLQMIVSLVLLRDLRRDSLREEEIQEIPVHELHEFVPELPHFAKPENNEATVDPAILRLDELIRMLPVDDVVKKLLVLRLGHAVFQVRETVILPERGLPLIGQTAIEPFAHNLSKQDYLALQASTRAALDAVAREAGRFSQ